jgi:hypothetical protein
MTKFQDLLAGSDRRSIGRANEAVTAVERDPARFEKLWDCLKNQDPIVRMRAADALEKITRKDAMSLQPQKSELCDDALDDGTAEVRWHLLPMASRLTLSAAEASRLMARLSERLQRDRSRIVRVVALQSAFELAERHPALQADIRQMLDCASVSESASLRARARLILKRLDGAAKRR